MPIHGRHLHVHKGFLVVEKMLVIDLGSCLEVDILAVVCIEVDGHLIVVVILLWYDVWIEGRVAKIRYDYVGATDRYKTFGELAFVDDGVAVGVHPTTPVLVLAPAVEGLTYRLPNKGIRYDLQDKEDISYTTRSTFTV